MNPLQTLLTSLVYSPAHAHIHAHLSGLLCIPLSSALWFSLIALWPASLPIATPSPSTILNFFVAGVESCCTYTLANCLHVCERIHGLPANGKWLAAKVKKYSNRLHTQKKLNINCYCS